MKKKWWQICLLLLILIISLSLGHPIMLDNENGTIAIDDTSDNEETPFASQNCIEVCDDTDCLYLCPKANKGVKRCTTQLNLSRKNPPSPELFLSSKRNYPSALLNRLGTMKPFPQQIPSRLPSHSRGVLQKSDSSQVKYRDCIGQFTNFKETCVFNGTTEHNGSNIVQLNNQTEDENHLSKYKSELDIEEEPNNDDNNKISQRKTAIQPIQARTGNIEPFVNSGYSHFENQPHNDSPDFKHRVSSSKESKSELDRNTSSNNDEDITYPSTQFQPLLYENNLENSFPLQNILNDNRILENPKHYTDHGHVSATTLSQTENEDEAYFTRSSTDTLSTIWSLEETNRNKSNPLDHITPIKMDKVLEEVGNSDFSNHIEKYFQGRNNHEYSTTIIPSKQIPFNQTISNTQKSVTEESLEREITSSHEVPSDRKNFNLEENNQHLPHAKSGSIDTIYSSLADKPLSTSEKELRQENELISTILSQESKQNHQLDAEKYFSNINNDQTKENTIINTPLFKTTDIYEPLLRNFKHEYIERKHDIDSADLKFELSPTEEYQSETYMETHNKTSEDFHTPLIAASKETKYFSNDRFTLENLSGKTESDYFEQKPFSSTEDVSEKHFVRSKNTEPQDLSETDLKSDDAHYDNNHILPSEEEFYITSSGNTVSTINDSKYLENEFTKPDIPTGGINPTEHIALNTEKSLLGKSIERRVAYRQENNDRAANGKAFNVAMSSYTSKEPFQTYEGFLKENDVRSKSDSSETLSPTLTHKPLLNFEQEFSKENEPVITTKGLLISKDNQDPDVNDINLTNVDHDQPNESNSVSIPEFITTSINDPSFRNSKHEGIEKKIVSEDLNFGFPTSEEFQTESTRTLDSSLQNSINNNRISSISPEVYWSPYTTVGITTGFHSDELTDHSSPNNNESEYQEGNGVELTVDNSDMLKNNNFFIEMEKSVNAFSERNNNNHKNKSNTSENQGFQETEGKGNNFFVYDVPQIRQNNIFTQTDKNLFPPTLTSDDKIPHQVTKDAEDDVLIYKDPQNKETFIEKKGVLNEDGEFFIENGHNENATTKSDLNVSLICYKNSTSKIALCKIENNSNKNDEYFYTKILSEQDNIESKQYGNNEDLNEEERPAKPLNVTSSTLNRSLSNGYANEKTLYATQIEPSTIKMEKQISSTDASSTNVDTYYETNEGNLPSTMSAVDLEKNKLIINPKSLEDCFIKGVKSKNSSEKEEVVNIEENLTTILPPILNIPESNQNSNYETNHKNHPTTNFILEHHYKTNDGFNNSNNLDDNLINKSMSVSKSESKSSNFTLSPTIENGAYINSSLNNLENINLQTDFKNLSLVRENEKQQRFAEMPSAAVSKENTMHSNWKQAEEFKSYQLTSSPTFIHPADSSNFIPTSINKIDGNFENTNVYDANEMHSSHNLEKLNDKIHHEINNAIIDDEMSMLRLLGINNFSNVTEHNIITQGTNNITKTVNSNSECICNNQRQERNSNSHHEIPTDNIFTHRLYHPYQNYYSGNENLEQHTHPVSDNTFMHGPAYMHYINPYHSIDNHPVIVPPFLTPNEANEMFRKSHYTYNPTFILYNNKNSKVTKEPQQEKKEIGIPPNGLEVLPENSHKEPDEEKSYEAEVKEMYEEIMPYPKEAHEEDNVQRDHEVVSYDFVNGQFITKRGIKSHKGDLNSKTDNKGQETYKWSTQNEKHERSFEPLFVPILSTENSEDPILNNEFYNADGQTETHYDSMLPENDQNVEENANIEVNEYNQIIPDNMNHNGMWRFSYVPTYIVIN